MTRPLDVKIDNSATVVKPILSHRATFESLPLEVHTLILGSISDRSSLQALIASSPPSLRLFNAMRERITFRVLQNQWSNSLFLLLSRIATPGNLGAANRQNELLKTIDDWESEKTMIHKGLHPVQIPFFLELDNSIDYFVEDFIATRLQVVQEFLRSKGLRSPEAKPRQVSGQEKSRVRAAFYSYELHACMQGLFRNADDPEPQHFGWKVIARLLENLDSSELEQLLCVCQYIMEKSAHHFDLVEEDFKQDILNSGMYHTVFPPPNLIKPIIDDHFLDGCDYGFREQQRVYINDNIRTSLRWLKPVFLETSPEQRLIAFDDYLYNWESPVYLPDVLQTIREPTRIDKDSPLIGTDREDVLRIKKDTGKTGTVSKALAWAFNNLRWPYLDGIVGDPAWNSLRSWGYAMWDDERIEDLGNFQLKPTDIRTTWVDYCDERLERPSVLEWLESQKEVWRKEVVGVVQSAE